MKTELDAAKDLSAQIAQAIRDAIVDGQLIVDERLPSESELAENFGHANDFIATGIANLGRKVAIRYSAHAVNYAEQAFDQVTPDIENQDQKRDHQNRNTDQGNHLLIANHLRQGIRSTVIDLKTFGIDQLFDGCA